MVEITDYDSAEAWLETQPHQVQVWFATRCALRALPGLGTWGGATTNGLAFATCRAMLISAAEAICPAAEMKWISGAKDAAALLNKLRSERANSNYNISDGSDMAGMAAYHTARSTLSQINAPREASFSMLRSADSAAESALAAAADADAAACNAATWDANASGNWDKLWPDEPQPDGLAQAWEALKGQWAGDPIWSFWIEWYERILNGDPMDWRLIFRIATEVTEEEWEAGQGVVAARIADIQADFLADTALPQAERVLFDPSSGKFTVEPFKIAKPDLLAATLTEVEDALEDALASLSNGLGEGSKVVRVVRRTIGKYGNNPQLIEMGFVSAHASLTRQMLVDELPNSEENLSLQSALEDAVVGLRATHPEIAENRKILNRQRFAEITPEQGKVIEDALPVLRAISDKDLGDDWVNDIPELLNTSMGPLPTGAPALPGADVSTRIFSRAAKMSILMRSEAVIRRIDDSSLFKAARIIAVLDGLVRLGIRLLSLIP